MAHLGASSPWPHSTLLTIGQELPPHDLDLKAEVDSDEITAGGLELTQSSPAGQQVLT